MIIQVMENYTEPAREFIRLMMVSFIAKQTCPDGGNIAQLAYYVANNNDFSSIWHMIMELRNNEPWCFFINKKDVSTSAGIELKQLANTNNCELIGAYVDLDHINVFLCNQEDIEHF